MKTNYNSYRFCEAIWKAAITAPSTHAITAGPNICEDRTAGIAKKCWETNVLSQHCAKRSKKKNPLKFYVQMLWSASVWHSVACTILFTSNHYSYDVSYWNIRNISLQYFVFAKNYSQNYSGKKGWIKSFFSPLITLYKDQG